jgi:hypothetical protein
MGDIDGFEDLCRAAAIMMIKFAPNQTCQDRFNAQSIAEIINTRRGDFIDQSKLTEALKNRKLRNILAKLYFGQIEFTKASTTMARQLGHEVTFKNAKIRDDASTVGQLASLIKRHFSEGQKGGESVAPEEEVLSESDNEKTGPPGRPPLSYDYLYKFHAAQLRRDRKRRKLEEEEEEEEEEEALSEPDDSSTGLEDLLETERANISSELLSLVERAGVFKTTIRGKKQLSLKSGVNLIDLQSTSLVSSAKMPMALCTALNLWFGNKITPEAQRFMCPSREAIDNAVARAADAEEALLISKFNSIDPHDPKRILNASLMIDEANKSGSQPTKAKLGNSLSGDFQVRKVAFETDRSGTKKVGSSADQSYDSLRRQLGTDALSMILTATSDWFACGGEAKNIMRKIDDMVEGFGDVTPQSHPKLFIVSSFNPTLIYDYSGRIREDCVRACEVIDAFGMML